MTVAIVIQARMGSTRLPGKVLKQIAGRPMLFYQTERLRRVRLAQRIAVATTSNGIDDEIVQFCASSGLECIRGSEHDVLARYSHAACELDASVIVRVTADCPLLDPELIDQAINTFLSAGPYDYVSNMLEPSWPYGMAVEVISAAALAEANREAMDAREREHVTPFIYWRPQRYRLKSLIMKPDLSCHRWTVDTAEDFELVERILATLYPRKPEFSMLDVLSLLNENPDWINLNAHVRQKSMTLPTEKF